MKQTDTGDTAKTEGRSGTVDNRDTLKPGQWDRSGAGGIEGGSPSSVGTDTNNPGSQSKTSAGT